MSIVKKDELKTYFAEAESWNDNRIQAAQRSRTLAWLVAGVASCAAIVAVGAVAALAPLKTVEPFVISMNETTGAVAVLTGLSGKKDVTYDEAVTKYFLAQYIRAREAYLPASAEQQFRQVSLLSTSAEQQRWASFFRGSNPQSPQVLIGPNGVAEVKIRAISFVNDEVANVRFTRLVRVQDKTESTDWIATVQFAYTQSPLSEADRMINPLGFQVATYRADPETVQ